MATTSHIPLFFLDRERRTELAHWLVSTIAHFIELTATTYKHDTKRFKALCGLAVHIASVIPEWPEEARRALMEFEGAIPELRERRRALEEILGERSLCGK